MLKYLILNLILYFRQLCEMCDVHVPARVSALCYCLKFSFRPKGLLHAKFSLFHKTDDKRFFTKMNPSMLFFFVTEVLVTGFWRVPTGLEMRSTASYFFFNKDFRIKAFFEGTSELIFGIWEYEDVQVRHCSLNLPFLTM